MMLGVTRPTVSEVAATLQRAGCITYRRGRVTIVDRARLEAAACECYAVTAAIVDGLGPARLRAPSESTRRTVADAGETRGRRRAAQSGAAQSR